MTDREVGCGETDHAGRRRLEVGDAVVEQAARIFRVLGDAPRMRLVAYLAGGAACVTELAMAEGDNLSTVSQRLRLLRAENVVSRRRRGKHVEYALADQHVADLVASVLGHAKEPRPATQTPEE
jgi:DNA-binding transcriptional ArsR family regulator